MAKLDGKVAIITGIADGIGKATAFKFAQEKAIVIGADIDQEKGLETIKKIESLEGKSLFVKTDVSISEDVDNLIKQALSFGKIDILVNNAGIEVVKKLIDTSEEEWDKTFNVNLKSVYLMCQKVIPFMIKQNYGIIVNNSSVSALVGSFSTVYSATKGGIVSFSKALAVEVAQHNIRVNCILPGAIETPMLTRVNEKLGDPEKIREERMKLYPMGRFGVPEEVANAIVFLASEDSSFITGQSLIVDGGYISK
ncbi:MAG: SDR family NAD(P)-dependent oxidoreductase [Candidatus Hodarchaeales archaeon]|jgi:NAD(P)-dependent dehydrogenase (short-subunit alcohol dehydrogenase family)